MVSLNESAATGINGAELSLQPLGRMSVPTPTFREVYLANFDYVWGVLRRLGVREQDTQDVAQKVFLVVYLKLPQFEHRALLRTWLFRICLNAASDYRRSAPVRREVVTGPDEIDLLRRALAMICSNTASRGAGEHRQRPF